MILLYKFYQLEMRNKFIALNAMQSTVSRQLDTTEKHRPVPEALRFSENKNRSLKIP